MVKIAKYLREDSVNIFVGNQTESYIGHRFMAGVSSYISLNRFVYLHIDIKLAKEEVKMIVIATCTLICEIIMVGFIIYDHRKRQ